MKYNRFEELPVWNAAIELAIGVYELSSKPEFKNRYSLRDQLERAAVSVSNNIAEGFERGTTQELLTFLYTSKASSGEVRSMLCMLLRFPAYSGLQSEIGNLKSLSESISRQLGAWADSLQNSTFRGQRYVTEKSRRSAKSAKDREEFLNQLRQIRVAPSKEAKE